MKSATIDTGKMKGREGISFSRKKELLGSSPQKRMQGSPKKGKIFLRPGQKPLQCFRCEGLGHGWHKCLTGKLQLERTDGSWGSLNAWKSWLCSYTNPKSKSMIYKILKQNNLHHNPDPLFRLVGEANESVVIVEG